MTSEPAGEDQRRPPTIELKATEVQSDPARDAGDSAAAGASGGSGADSTAQPEPSAAETASRPGRSGQGVFHAVSAAIGAVVAAAIVAGLWFANIVPPRQGTGVAAPASSATSPSRDVEELSARLDKLERAIKTAPPPQAAAAPLAALEARTKSLGNTLAAINHRLDDVAGTSASAAKEAAAAQSAAQAATAEADKAGQSNQAYVPKSDFDALAARVAALENTAKGLADATSQASSEDRAARLTVAAQALDAAIARGAPYQAELAAAKALGANETTTAPLAPFAASGVPRATVLGQQLAELVPALRRAAEVPAGSNSFLGRLEANARHLVRITPVEAPAGNAPSAVIARIEIDASQADIAAALNDIAALPDKAKPVVAAWAAKAKAREAALQAGRQITADALTAMSKPAAQ